MLDQASIRVTVRPDSLEVTDDISQKDKNEIETKVKQEVLETDRYPEITFESSAVSPTQIGRWRYAVNIAGQLTLHGITRSQTVIAQVALNDETFRAYRGIFAAANRLRNQVGFCRRWCAESEG